jgi:hypothetical protein
MVWVVSAIPQSLYPQDRDPGTHCTRGADKSLARPGRKQATTTKPAEMGNTPH